MDVQYKCSCMQAEATVQVDARRPDEDVTFWMQNVVIAALYLDHRKRSPLCRAAEMEYAKIPVPEDANYIGEERKPH